MLWTEERVTTVCIMRDLLLPSVACLVAPLSLITLNMDNKAPAGPSDAIEPLNSTTDSIAPGGRVIFSVGVSALALVPVLKSSTGLPPWVGMLFGLGSLWLTCDALHAGKADEEDLKASNALQRIDVESIIFFIGILLSIDALDSSGVLKALATWLNDNVQSSEIVAIVLGAASSVVDNVPLVRDNIVLSFPAPCILLNCSLKLGVSPFAGGSDDGHVRVNFASCIGSFCLYLNLLSLSGIIYTTSLKTHDSGSSLHIVREPVEACL
jgi:hypothetical protein